MNKKYIILALSFLLTAGMFAENLSAGENIKRFAMVVGANYGGPGRVRLKYAVSDATSFLSVLKKMGGVSSRDGMLLSNPDRRNFISAISKIKRKVKRAKKKYKHVEFVFYYSGHSNEEAILLGREKIYYRELKKGIKAVSADVRIAILDSCSSGAFTRIKGGTFRPPFILDESFNMKGDAFMTSSSSDEASQESERLRGSFFTHYLVSGLRGAADMIHDGRITLNEAYQYAYNETLARTERTLGGAQHPNYEIQMSGTGDVIMTDIRKSSAGIVLDKLISGRVYIRDSRNTLVAELDKPYGKEVTIGLNDGDFTIVHDGEKGIYEATTRLSSGKKQMIALGNFTKADVENTVLRGEGRSGKRYALFDDKKIKHGGAATLSTQLTRMNDGWANISGLQLSWIINHRLSLGLAGYGLVYPSKREKLTGITYEGEEPYLNVGMGGAYASYYFFYDRLFTLAPGITIGGGGFGYHKAEEDEDDSEDEGSIPTPFLYVMPEITVYANILEFLRVGAGFSYRYSDGIQEPGFNDRDFRNFSVHVSVSGGWF